MYALKKLLLLLLLTLSTSAEDSSTCRTPPRNCREVLEQGHTASKIYTIQPKYASESISVQCNMRTMGGGWTYILNRYDGSQNFYQDWENYKNGFGKLTKEFWLGLENIHLLTGYEINELLIELVDWDNKEVYAHYKLFSIGDEREGYSLKYLSGYTGTAGDDLSHELGMKFSTKDKDQDVWNEDHCARFSNGGWWYRDCKWTHPTGLYLGEHFDSSEKLKGMYFVSFHGNGYSVKEVRMMVRPARPRSANPLLQWSK